MIQNPNKGYILTIEIHSTASTFLLISEHTRDPYWNATVQAGLQVVIITSQALGPALGGALFAFSVNHQNIVNGYLIWVVTFTLGKWIKLTLPISHIGSIYVCSLHYQSPADPTYLALLLSLHSFTLYEVTERSDPVSTSATISRESGQEGSV